ncbi:MAG: c-type cytochrome [Phycisphaerales bacterium]
MNVPAPRTANNPDRAISARRIMVRASALAAGLAAMVGVLGMSRLEPPLAAERDWQFPRAGDEPVEQTGWLARYTPAGGGAAKRVATSSPYAAMALAPGQSVHPAVPPADLEVVYDAEVPIPVVGKYRFGVEFEGGTGQLRVLGEKMTAPVTIKLEGNGIDGVFTNWLDLPPGKALVQVSFKRSGDAKTRVRTLWEKQGFGKMGFRTEPIPPTSARVPAQAAELVRSAKQADRGRVLLGELGCVHCHALESGGHQHAHAGGGVEGSGGVSGGGTEPDFSTPIIHAMAPSLQELCTRVNPYWITKWIADPQGEKPGCGMPGVLRGKDMGTDATNITHFLYSLAPNYQSEAWATEQQGLEMGRRLFQTLGCVACHGAAPGQKDVPQPLTAAASKWNPSELSKFLMHPRQVKPSGRMPEMNLTKQEADLLATYLASQFGESSAPKQPFKLEQERIEPGRAAFAARGCASCHAVTDSAGKMVASGVAAKKMLDLTSGGCIDPKGTPKAPRYTLREDDRDAIKAALKALKDWSGGGGHAGTFASAPSDRAHQMFDQFNCRRCHEVYAEGGVSEGIDALFTTIGEADLGEEGRIPPRLIGPGTKLTTPWIHQVLENAGRARPYMGARMPQFGHENVGFIAEQLACMEGIWPGTDAPEPTPSDEMTRAGRLLAGVNGLNCISCHVVGDNAPSGTPGPDMTMFAARIRYEWWMDYVHAPARYKPGTRMPAFYENGVGTVTSVYGGDSVKQADALWAYFNLGEFMPIPDGITKPDGYAIKVGSRPVVMRTFLKDAGSRGIAVGFPESQGAIHFAFDAEKVRLVDAWQGAFLNASGAWAGRGGNVTGGQGGAIWSAPDGPAIVIADKPPQTWPTLTGRDAGYRFKGYRLDENGVPTFDYEITLPNTSVVLVSERFEPAPDKMIKRTFRVSGLPGGSSVWVRAGKGVQGNTAVENVSAVKLIGTDDDTTIQVTPAREAPVAFSFTVKP